MQSVGVYSQQVDSVGGSFCLVGALIARLVQVLFGWCTSCLVGALETSAPPENSIRLIRLIRC